MINSATEHKQIKIKRKISKGEIACIIILSLSVLGLIIPYLWGLITSFKSNLEVRYNVLGLPTSEYGGWQFSNYKKVFSLFKVEYISTTEGYRQIFYFGDLLFNSFTYSLLAAATPIIVTYMIAYVRNMYEFKFLKLFDLLVYIMMALPIFGTLPSSIQVFKFFRIYNNFPAFVLIARFTFGGMNYFIMGAAIRSVPKAFTEAAEIDGAGEIQKLFKVMLSLNVSVIMTLYVLSFYTVLE